MARAPFAGRAFFSVAGTAPIAADLAFGRHYFHGAEIMIDLATESLLSLAQAAKILPPGRNGKKTHLSTVLRWITHGAKGPDGELLRLDGLRLGGRWLTSKEALQRFAERLTPALDRRPINDVRTARQRERAAERAGRELERRWGI